VTFDRADLPYLVGFGGAVLVVLGLAFIAPAAAIVAAGVLLILLAFTLRVG
jgi:hypothetical protein